MHEGKPRSKRIVILTQYFPPEIGASQIRLSELARELRRHGHEVTVVTAMPNYPKGAIFPEYRGRLYFRETWEGLRVYRSWIYPSSSPVVAKRLLSYFSFAVSSLLNLLLLRKSDVLFVESPPLFLGLTGYLGSRLLGIPYVLNVVDLWPDSAKELGFIGEGWSYRSAKRLEMFLYRNAWKVCGVTRGIVEAIRKSGVVSDGNVLFLPNGVDLDLFRPLPPDERLVNEWGTVSKKTFVYAGTHGFAQGLDVILEAAELLSDRDDVRFLMIGDGPERGRLLAMKSEKKLGNVLFAGPYPVETMPRVFSSVTASIVPLRRLELFRGARPSKLYPSLACRTPVIYCGEGEAAELIEEAGCGVVVEPENPKALARAVEKMAGDQEWTKAMGQRGRELVEREFSWSRIVDGWQRDLWSE